MIRYRPPTIVPGVKAPRSIESEVASRPTVDGGRGAGAGPNSVGRRDADPRSAPQEGQYRPEAGKSEPQREQRVTCAEVLSQRPGPDTRSGGAVLFSAAPAKTPEMLFGEDDPGRGRGPKHFTVSRR